MDFWKQAAADITDTSSVLDTGDILDIGEVLDTSEVLEIEDDQEDIDDGDDFIIINSKKVFKYEILNRQRIIKKNIAINVYNNLSIEEKLIIDLPVLLIKLNWPYAAFCQLHWLEGSGDDVIIPYDYIYSYQRVKDVYQEMIDSFKKMEYASYDDYVNATGKIMTDGSADFLMYDFNLTDSAYIAYQKSLEYINTIKDFGEHIFGNFNFDEPPPKMNIVRSFKIGSVFGTFDDLGTSLGRFSLRVYVKGVLQDQDLVDDHYRKLYLNILEIGFRFYDEFSFNGNDKLGDWKYDLVNVEEPERYNRDWISLHDSNYRSLRNRDIGLGNDFNIKSECRFASIKTGLKVKQPIIFFTKK